jgi:3-oxoacyl-[acyl-carrier protein] reductase
MNLDLINRNAIVCGSTQGLGWATAVELALLGANVTLMARNESSLLDKLPKLDTSKDQKHDYIVADFSDPKQVENSINQYLTNNKTIHILVNNTGGPAGGPIVEAKPEAFIQAFSNHLICNQIMVTAVVEGMKKAQFGRIINIISTSVKQPINGLGVSNTIRAAVAAWAKTLANELGQYGITVNNVLPGFTQTARLDYVLNNKAEASGKSLEEIRVLTANDIPAGRIGLPEEFGAAAAFLCSPAASYINGINLPVDGGRLSSL